MLRETIKQRTHVFFWTLGVILCVLGFVYRFIIEETTTSVNVHDTYFVIAHFHLYAVSVLWMAFCGLVYWIVKRFKFSLSFLGVVVHIILTLIGLLSWIFPLDFLTNLISMNYEENNFWEAIYMLSSLLFLIGQVVFLFILLVGLIGNLFRTKK